MSKSTIFVLSCFLLVTVTIGTDMTGLYRTPLKKPVLAAVTASDRCLASGHVSACLDEATSMCAHLRCETRDGRIVALGQAPDDTWCGSRRVCRAGRCVFQRTIPEPATTAGHYILCPDPRI